MSVEVKRFAFPTFGQLTLAALGACLATLMTIEVASAHVTVTPREAPPDSNQTFTVRVPTEKDEPTTTVRVEFPTGLTVSRFQSKPGWTRQVERDAQQRITAVIWSGGQVNPGEYDDFALTARTPKEAGALTFKAYQTYQGGETVEWAGAEGSERPAALVTVQGATATGAANPAETHSESTGGAQSSAKPAAGGDGSIRTPATSGGSDLSLVAALATGVLALIAIVLAGIALARRPRAA